MLLSLILCGFLAASFGLVPIVAGFVSDIPYSSMDFAKKVLVWRAFHDEQSTPSLVAEC